MRYIAQYCVLYSFCCNVRPLYCRAYAQAYSLCLYSKMQSALAVLPRIPARAHSQAERHCLALSPPRGQGSGRQIYAAEKRPHTVEYDYGGVDRTVPPDLCRRVRHGGLLIFCFLAADCVLFAYATGGERYLRREYPPRDKCTKAKRGGYTLFYPGHNDIHTKHDSGNAAKKLRSLATAVGKRFKRISFTVRQRSGISHSFSLQIADAPQNNASSVALL